jgi:oxygen-dependent protoporphyrinogen oxidase
MSSQHPTVAVIGAGVGGLAAAWRLSRLGFTPLIFEAADTLGGAILTGRDEDGWRPELGPNTIPDKNCVVSDLIRELGIEHKLLAPDLSARRRFVVRSGRLHALPSSLQDFITTPLWSAQAKLRLLAEPLVPRREDDGVDESLANFVRRRLGPELVDYAIDPFIAGTYAGKPQHLSALHTVGRVVALEQRSGSIAMGALRNALGRALSNDPSSLQKKPLDLVNFEDGVQTLTDALADNLGDAGISLSSPVSAVVQRERGWTISYRDGKKQRSKTVDAVVLALPAWVIGKLDIRDKDGAALDPSFLADITHPPAQMLSLGFRREDVGHPLDGFGMLIPEIEGKNILGAVFNSTIFPRRAPPGHVLMTVFLGGARAPHLGRLPREEALQTALIDLRELLDVRAAPVKVWGRQWDLAIPQPEVGWAGVLSKLAAFEARAPGLKLTGNWRAGISVSDTIAQGCAAADSVASHLRMRAR